MRMIKDCCGFDLSAQLAQALESPVVHQNPEALYSMPLKRGQRVSSSTTMQTTLEVRDAMQHVHDLSSDDENGPINRVGLGEI